MAMLDRYRKTGGFVQLVALIEGFTAQKQDKFLAMIEAEDPVWAEALRSKMLSVNRILGWDEQIVAEIIHRLPEKTLAVFLSGITGPQNEKVMKFISPSEKRKIDASIEGKSEIPEGEKFSSQLKLIECVRAMINDGEIRLEKIDEELMIDEKIEESLAAAAQYFKGLDLVPVPQTSERSSSAPTSANPKPSVSGGLAGDNQKLLLLEKENKALRQEVKILREKLEQIKKIA